MLKRSSSGYRVGIIDPLTLVGKEIRSLLRERGIPYAHLELLDSTGGDDATLTVADDEPAVVTHLTPEAMESLDIVFYCGRPGSTGSWLERSADDLFAIDLTQPSSLAAEGTPVVAGINLGRIEEATRLVVSPHPIAIPIALILDRLQSVSTIGLCAATVVQPASESGQAGIDELYEQTIRVLNVQSVPKNVFEQQLAFNLYPAPDAARLEQYAAGQVRHVLGPELPLTLSLTQGTLFHGHTFSLFVQLTDEETNVTSVEDALRESNAIVVADSDDSFGTIDAGGRDEVVVSRVAADPTISGGFWIWAVSDNLRRSSALNAVLALEHVIATFGEPVN